MMEEDQNGRATDEGMPEPPSCVACGRGQAGDIHTCRSESYTPVQQSSFEEGYCYEIEAYGQPCSLSRRLEAQRDALRVVAEDLRDFLEGHLDEPFLGENDTLRHCCGLGEVGTDSWDSTAERLLRKATEVLSDA